VVINDNAEEPRSPVTKILLKLYSHVVASGIPECESFTFVKTIHQNDKIVRILPGSKFSEVEKRLVKTMIEGVVSLLPVECDTFVLWAIWRLDNPIAFSLNTSLNFRMDNLFFGILPS